MIIVLRPDASEREVDHIVDRLRELGLKSQLSTGQERTIIGVIGDDRILQNQPLTALPGVESVLPILAPWKLVSREFKKEGTIIDVGGVKIGANRLAIMAGPCAVERLELTVGIAHEVKAAGASILRGGAYKPRTSPYSFQGLGREGLDYLAEARKQTGLPVVSEILDTRDIELFLEKADIIQIGARNMQNFELLKEVGAYDKPVLLKRGLSATIKEFLLSAEYIMSRGNRNVMLCERGIRTFETQYRNTLDLAAIPTLKELSHLPVIVDPSHATGRWNLVAPMSKAAVAAGADGILIEVHSNPECALCDGEESIKPTKFKELMHDMRKIAHAVGRAREAGSGSAVGEGGQDAALTASSIARTVCSPAVLLEAPTHFPPTTSWKMVKWFAPAIVVSVAWNPAARSAAAAFFDSQAGQFRSSDAETRTTSASRRSSSSTGNGCGRPDQR